MFITGYMVCCKYDWNGVTWFHICKPGNVHEDCKDILLIAVYLYEWTVIVSWCITCRFKNLEMKHSYYIAAHHMSHPMREVEYYIINSQVLAPRALVCIPTRNGSFERQVGIREIKYPLHHHDVYVPHVYVDVMLCQPPHVLQCNFSQFSRSLPWQHQLQTESWVSLPSHSLLDAWLE